MKTNVFVSVILIAVLCTFPKVCINGAAQGINICLNSVIPSLFPFFVASKMFIMSGGAAFFGKKAGGFMRIFGLGKKCAAPFVLGLISGYPVGAKAACDLYKANEISKDEAQGILSFCNNCGPCFLIGTVGAKMIGNVKTGYILYIIHIISAVSVGLLFKHTVKNNTRTARSYKTECKKVSRSKSIFTDAVEESVKTMLNVCGYIVFFSVVTSLLKCVCKSFTASGFFEITTAISDLCALGNCSVKIKIVIISYLCGWAGLCVNMQTKKFIDGADLSFKKYLFSKLCHSAFGFFYSFLYVTLFPSYIPVFVSDKCQNTFFEYANIMLLICIAIFLLYVLKKRKNTVKRAFCNKTVK